MKNLIYVFILLFSLNIHAQGTSLLIFSDQEIEILNSDLIIYQKAGFPFGFGNNCPNVLSYSHHVSNETIIVDVLYNETGIWQQAGCVAKDTLVINNIDNGFYNLVINTNTIVYDSLGTDIDTLYQVDVDTFSNIELTVDEVSLVSFNIPNPIHNILMIEPSNGQHQNIKLMEMINLNGKMIYRGHYQKALNVSFLEKGVFILKLYSEDNIYVYKLLKK